MTVSVGRKYVYQFNNDVMFLVPVVDTVKMISISSYDNEDFSLFDLGPELWKEIEMGIKEVVIDGVGTFEDCLMRVSCPNPGNNIRFTIYRLNGDRILDISDVVYKYNRGMDDRVNTRTSREDDAFWVAGVVPPGYEEKQDVYYTVTYMSSGHVYTTQVVKAGNPVPFLDEDPEKYKSEFIDWYLDEAFTELFDPYQPITKDITVYAKWNRLHFEFHRVKFWSAGDLYDSQTVEHQETIIMPPTPERRGYEFEGWYLDPDVWEERFYQTNAILSDLSIHAKWYRDETIEPATTVRTVKFWSQNKLFAEIEIANGNVIDDMPIPPDQDDYIFYGWYHDQDFTELFNWYLPIENSMNIYARWEEYEDNDLLPLTVDNTIRFTRNRITGYTSVEEHNCNGISHTKDYENSSISVDITKAGTYYVTGTGHNVYVNVRSGISGEVYIHLYDLHLDNSDLIMINRTSPAIVDSGIDNTVFVYVDGKNSLASKYEVSDHSLIAHAEESSILTLGGQGTFNYVKMDGIGAIDGEYSAECTVIFRYGDITYYTQEVDFGTRSTIPDPPERVGYLFGGWYEDESYTRLFNFYSPVYTDKILYGRWIYDDDPIVPLDQPNMIRFTFDETRMTTNVETSELTNITWTKDSETNAIRVDILNGGSYILTGSGENVYINVLEHLDIIDSEIDIHIDNLHIDNTNLVAKNRYYLSLIETGVGTTTNLYIDNNNSLVTTMDDMDISPLIYAYGNYTLNGSGSLVYTTEDGSARNIEPSSDINSLTFDIDEITGKTTVISTELNGMQYEIDPDSDNIRVAIMKSGVYTLSGNCNNVYIDTNSGLDHVTIKLEDFHDNIKDLIVYDRYSSALIDNGVDTNLTITFVEHNSLTTNVRVVDNSDTSCLVRSYNEVVINEIGDIEYIYAEGEGQYIAPTSFDPNTTDNAFIFSTDEDSSETYVRSGRYLNGIVYQIDEGTGYIHVLITEDGSYIFSGEINNIYIDILNNVSSVELQFNDLHINNSDLHVNSTTRGNSLISSKSNTMVTVDLVGNNSIVSDIDVTDDPFFSETSVYSFSGEGAMIYIYLNNNN